MQTFHHKLWRVEWIIQWPWARSINAILIENFSSLSLIFRFRLTTSDKIRTCEAKIGRPIFVGKPARTSWFKFGFLLGILIKRIVSGNDQLQIWLFLVPPLNNYNKRQNYLRTRKLSNGTTAKLVKPIKNSIMTVNW